MVRFHLKKNANTGEEFVVRQHAVKWFLGMDEKSKIPIT